MTEPTPSEAVDEVVRRLTAANARVAELETLWRGAEDECTRLRARVAALEAALRPIAEKQTWKDLHPDVELNPQQEERSCLISVEHIYKARAVLAKGRER